MKHISSFIIFSIGIIMMVLGIFNETKTMFGTNLFTLGWLIVLTELCSINMKSNSKRRK